MRSYISRAYTWPCMGILWFENMVSYIICIEYLEIIIIMDRMERIGIHISPFSVLNIGLYEVNVHSRSYHMWICIRPAPIDAMPEKKWKEKSVYMRREARMCRTGTQCRQKHQQQHQENSRNTYWNKMRSYLKFYVLPFDNYTPLCTMHAG